MIKLQPPISADLSLNFHQAAPDKLIAQFILPEQPGFSGLVNGLIKVSGELARPEVDGYLEVSQGHLGELDFISADINLKGNYPKVLIADSRICREEDSFIMEGEVDLSNLENKKFIDIEIKPDKGMLFQGWDITSQRDNQVHLSKSVDDDIKITFDTFLEDNEISQDSYQNELGLEYRIAGDNLLKVRLKKDEGILGVEQRVKF